MNRRLWVGLWACCVLSTVAAGKDRASIEPVEAWPGFVGGGKTELHYVISSSEAMAGQVEWAMAIDRRMLDRGTAACRVEAGKPATIAIPLTMPEVKQGLVLSAQLAVNLRVGDEAEPAGRNTRTIRVFAPDPFADRSQWLKNLHINLFDPEGRTAERFDKVGIPYSFTKNVASIEAAEGVLVVGEGTAWKDHRSLWEAAVKSAARGRRVLCLAPGEAALALPGADGAELPAPVSLSLRGADVIREIDKRLESITSPSQGRIAGTSIAIRGERDLVTIESGGGDRGWSFVEARYPAGGKLVICGFGIVRNWDAGPAPRYLLSGLFARLAAEKENTEQEREQR